MSPVAVEIARRPETEPEPSGVILVADVEDLNEGIIPGCGDDNPYAD
jgi:hypothetical protein